MSVGDHTPLLWVRVRVRVRVIGAPEPHGFLDWRALKFDPLHGGATVSFKFGIAG